MKINLSKLAVATAGMLATSINVNASNGIMAYGNGMISHGVSGAGVANASEVMSGIDNPALLSCYYASVPSVELSQQGGPDGFPRIKMDQHALGLAYQVEF